MGSAAVAQSKSRKPRPSCKTVSSDKKLSPLVILPENVPNTVKRSCPRRTASDQKLVQQENIRPYISRLIEGKSLVKSSPQNVSNKRKPADEESEGPVSLNGITAEHTTLERPRTMEGLVLRPKPDAELAENLEAPSSAKLLSNNELFVLERICNPSGDQIELQSRILNAGKCHQDTVAISMPQSTEIRSMEEQQAPSKDGGVEAVLSTSTALILQKEYERLFSRYKELKVQRSDGVDALHKEQKPWILEFMKATEALLEFYKGENLSLKKQLEVARNPELVERCELFEKANVNCRNELLQEQSRGSELRRENKRVKSLLLEQIADKQKKEAAEPMPGQGTQNRSSIDIIIESSNDGTTHGSAKLVQRMLEALLGLQLSRSHSGCESHLHFQHCATGFAFNIREVCDEDIAEIVEGGELMYQNIAIGTCTKAVNWMKEKELIFGINQAKIFFRRLVGFLNRGFC